MGDAFLAMVLLATEEEPAPEAADVVAGWWGLILFVGLAVATGFLVRSMSRRLRGIRFDEDAAGSAGRDPEGRPSGDGTPPDGPSGDR